MVTTWDELRRTDARHPSTVSWELAEDVRARCRVTGTTQAAVARTLGIDFCLVSRIMLGKSHRHALSAHIFAPNYTSSNQNRQANAFLNRAPAPSQSFASWAHAHGLSEAHIAAHEARIRPPQRVMCQVCPGCGLLVPDDERHTCRVGVAA